jgi:hypothetical protein
VYAIEYGNFFFFPLQITIFESNIILFGIFNIFEVLSLFSLDNEVSRQPAVGG